MSAIGFGGSMQYVAITLLVSAFDPLQAFLLALMVNARHVFYGLSMLDKYKGLGKARFFLVFALCDETFSLASTLDPPEGVERRDFYLWITLLDYLYWVGATALAALLAVPGGPGAAGGGDVSGQGPAPRHHGAAAPLEEQRAALHRRRHGGVYASGAGDLCLTDFPRINPSRPAQNGTAARGRGSFLRFRGDTMRKHLFFWELAGFVFTGAAGTLLHFAYEWSGGSVLVAAFSAVNESTWEHMKLLFFPLFLFSLVQFCLMGRNYPNLPAVRAVSTLTGLALIPVLFYTYTGVLGYHMMWADIAVFFLADLGAFLVDFSLLRRGRLSQPWQQLLGLAALWALAFCFVWCTFRPVHLALWRDPVTNKFGIL